MKCIYYFVEDPHQYKHFWISFTSYILTNNIVTVPWYNDALDNIYIHIPCFLQETSKKPCEFF